MIKHVVWIPGMTQYTILVFKGNKIGFVVVERCRMIDIVATMNQIILVFWLHSINIMEDEE